MSLIRPSERRAGDIDRITARCTNRMSIASAAPPLGLRGSSRNVMPQFVRAFISANVVLSPIFSWLLAYPPYHEYPDTELFRWPHFWQIPARRDCRTGLAIIDATLPRTEDDLRYQHVIQQTILQIWHHSHFRPTKYSRQRTTILPITCTFIADRQMQYWLHLQRRHNLPRQLHCR